jgi:O-antigen/teichoic acid export membrane protein
LSGIKKLAGQTLWYGVPTIFTRFLSYAIAILAYRYSPLETNNYNLIYAIIPFLNVLYVYGLETSYFRFTSIDDKTKVYNTLSLSLLFSTLFFTFILFFCKNGIVTLFNIKAHPEYVTWMLLILVFDTLAVLPFCKLREEGRPKKFASIKVINIILNVGFVLFFSIFCEKYAKSHPNSFLLKWYNPNTKVGYFILGNLFASVITLLLLYKEILSIQFKFDKVLWRKVMVYSYPLIIVGFGGMINEMLSRALFERFSTLPETQAKIANSIFAANFKLAVLVTIFIQIFKMAAEPFFFKKANDADAPKTYARVMKFFVIACCFIFLVVALFTNLWKYLIAYKHPEYGEGITVVPILALGYIFIGIYYNLSVWYKLTNKNLYGAYITVVGVIITVVFNYLLVPYFGYVGSAWATFLCYGYMMVISFVRGQKYYPIPYAWKKLCAYIIICVLLFFMQRAIIYFIPNTILYYVLALFFISAFMWFIVQVERKELSKIPYLNKFIKVP